MDLNRLSVNKPLRSSGPADHLANERTFLAWIRTGIALMGFGFVIVKFTLFIRQIAFALGDAQMLPGKGYSAPVGVTMVAMGGVISLLAFLRYRQIEKQLANNQFYPLGWLSALVALCIVIASILLVLYLMPGAR